MYKLSYLFSDKKLPEGWETTKSALCEGIDKAMEKSTNKEVLTVMKDLLEEINITSSMSDYVEENKPCRKDGLLAKNKY